MNSTEKEKVVSLWSALADLGWFFGLLTAIAGGPSAISMFKILFVDWELTPALQWIVDSYDQLVGTLAGVVEPVVVPALNWLNQTFKCSLTLHPFWRPLFVLLMTYILSFVRFSLKKSEHKSLAYHAKYFPLWTALALTASLVFGTTSYIGVTVFGVAIVISILGVRFILYGLKGQFRSIEMANEWRTESIQIGFTLLGAICVAVVVLVVDRIILALATL